ncbi:ankyrin repeat domain-containing protein 53 [Hyperolius riggenbachi]|uniref:ankyrin repeat domain-containing protein 53 n=1 Tax=Hyperolius riggenbachi TaxID=752182 RepID=UPI0035A31BE0
MKPARNSRKTPWSPSPPKVTPDKTDVPRDQLTAASIGNVEWLRLCLQAAGSLMEEDENGFTALHMAALHGRLQCLKFLIEDHKMDVDLPSRSGWRALHLVLNQKNGKRAKECLLYLLQHGDNINVQSESKSTPLHQAAREGLEECLGILVKNGANVHAKDSEGRQPIDLCMMWCHASCARYLRSAMWKIDKNQLAQEMKKLEKLKRALLEMRPEIQNNHTCHGQTHACAKADKESERPKEMSFRTHVSSVPRQGQWQETQKIWHVGNSNTDSNEKMANRPSRKQEEELDVQSEDIGEGVETQDYNWNPSCNPAMPPITDIYRTPTLRLGTDPDDVTYPDFSSIVVLEKDEHGEPQVRSIQGQLLPTQPHLPYETIQRCLFPNSAPKERLCMPHEFKASHIFDVPKKQQAVEGRKPASEISFHLRRNLDSKLKRNNKDSAVVIF